MLKTEAVERYGRALFDIAVEENQLDQFIEELVGVKELLETSAELEKFLYHPRIQESDKKEVMDKLLASKVSPFILNFIKITIDKDREPLIKDIIDYFQDLARAAKNILQVQVETAFPLTSEDHAALTAKLSKLTGKVIELMVEVKPALIGGMRIRIGDRIIDGTIKRHLERIKENLVTTQVS